MSTTKLSLPRTTRACHITMLVEGKDVEKPLVLFQDDRNHEYGVELKELANCGFTREFLAHTKPRYLTFFLHQIKQENGVTSTVVTCWLPVHRRPKVEPFPASLLSKEQSAKAASPT